MMYNHIVKRTNLYRHMKLQYCDCKFGDLQSLNPKNQVAPVWKVKQQYMFLVNQANAFHLNIWVNHVIWRWLLYLPKVMNQSFLLQITKHKQIATLQKVNISWLPKGRICKLFSPANLREIPYDTRTHGNSPKIEGITFIFVFKTKTWIEPTILLVWDTKVQSRSEVKYEHICIVKSNLFAHSSVIKENCHLV